MIAVVMHANVPRQALRPLAIRLSFLRRIPSSEAMIEYAVTTKARASANWPICAAMLALSYAGCGFFLVFRGTLGLHLVGDEYAVMSKLAFNNGLRTVNECIGRRISADVLYGETHNLLRLLILLADHEVDCLAVMLDRSHNDIAGHLQVARICLVFGRIEFRNSLVIRVTFLVTGVSQISKRE